MHSLVRPFANAKCKIVTFSHKDYPPQRRYVFCGVELEQVDGFSFPYLRVTISNKLKWSAHVSMTAAKANKLLGTIQRNLWNCPKNVKEIAYRYIPSTTEGICKCGLGSVFKEIFQCSGKGST